MPYQINPAFIRHPKEAALIGHILSSFGELEVAVCYNTAFAHGLVPTILSTLYSIRTTSTRIDTAIRLIEPATALFGITDDMAVVAPMIWHCIKIRNQYAHCNWGDTAEAGLFFADLQNSANNPGFKHDWKHVDVALLQSQSDFLNNAMEWLNYIQGEITTKHGARDQNLFSKPTKSNQPPLHNPPSEHVPPWLDEAEKELHLAKALAGLGGPPTPTPKQLELEQARAAKKEARRLHAERSLQGETPPQEQPEKS